MEALGFLPRPAETNVAHAEPDRLPYKGHRHRSRALPVQGMPLGLDQGRIDKIIVTQGTGRCITINDGEVSVEKGAHMVAGIADRGRGTDENRSASVNGADPHEPAKHVGHV
jgi:hypothetical protein